LPEGDEGDEHPGREVEQGGLSRERCPECAGDGAGGQVTEALHRRKQSEGRAPQLHRRQGCNRGVLGCKAVIQCLIESALGVERAFDLARAHARVAGIGLGEADLAADLGVHAEGGLAYARSRIVVAARAAGLPPPVQSVYTNVRDLDGLRRSSEAGRDLGFFGRSAVHPAQIPVINGVYTPSEAEMAEARTLVAQLEAAAETATGAFVLADGRFVDRAVVESARRTLALGSYAVAVGDSDRPPRAHGDMGEDVL